MAKKTFTIFKSNSTEGNFFCEVRKVQLQEQNVHLPTQFNAWSYLSFFQNFWSLLKRIIYLISAPVVVVMVVEGALQ